MLFCQMIMANFNFTSNNNGILVTLQEVSGFLQSQINFSTTLNVIVDLSQEREFVAYCIPVYIDVLIDDQPSTIPRALFKELTKKQDFLEDMTIVVNDNYLSNTKLIPVLIHELIHGLGFVSSIQVAYGDLAGPQSSDYYLFSFPTLFDRFLYKNYVEMKTNYFNILKRICVDIDIDMRQIDNSIKLSKIASFLSKNTAIDKVDISLTMRDVYHFRLFDGTFDQLYVLHTLTDRIIYGFKPGGTFQHVVQGLMNPYGAHDNNTDQFRKDGVWKILCTLGYDIEGFYCPEYNVKILNINKYKSEMGCNERLEWINLEASAGMTSRFMLVLGLGIFATLALIWCCKRTTQFCSCKNKSK